MIEPRRCSKCGAELAADAPNGVCAACLSKSPASLAATSPWGSRFAPPKPEELARHFPQLEILALLGQGGMGAVYKARQPSLDRLVAIKILPVEIAGDSAFAERFTREARALAQLNHPNIVGIHDFGQTDGLYYFVMEYVDGVSLRQLVGRRHRTDRFGRPHAARMGSRLPRPFGLIRKRLLDVRPFDARWRNRGDGQGRAARRVERPHRKRFQHRRPHRCHDRRRIAVAALPDSRSVRGVLYIDTRRISR